MTAKNQKAAFQTLVEDTLGTDCDFDAVRNIHDTLYEMIEEQKELPNPVVLDKTDIKNILAGSGVHEEKLETFEKHYEETAESDAPMMASNIANVRKFEVKTPDVTIQVNPARSDLVETKIIDGRPCLVIAINDAVEVNGIPVRVPLPDTDQTEGSEIPFEE